MKEAPAVRAAGCGPNHPKLHWQFCFFFYLWDWLNYDLRSNAFQPLTFFTPAASFTSSTSSTFSTSLDSFVEFIPFIKRFRACVLHSPAFYFGLPTLSYYQELYFEYRMYEFIRVSLEFQGSGVPLVTQSFCLIIGLKWNGCKRC